MDIEIKNIGKIRYADIALDGITIIAGENNTGKSTIGKALFSIFRGLSDWQKIYEEACAMNLYKVLTKCAETLERFCMEHTGAVRRRTNRVNQLIKNLSYDKEIITSIEDFKYFQAENNGRSILWVHVRLQKQLRKFCESYVQIYPGNAKKLMSENQSFFEDWVCNTAVELEYHVEIDEKILQANMIQETFRDCFKGQYLREGSDGACIRITDEDKVNEITLWGMGCVISSPINFDRSIYFIETPKLFDQIGNLWYGGSAREGLRQLMVPNVFLNMRMLSQISITEDTVKKMVEVIPEELKEILDMLREEMGGYAYFYEKSGIKFKDNELKDSIEAQNVSTGLKAMAFLEYALRMGAIQKGDTLILDEPEINLHPEWQVSYARVLVLLHKKYDLTVLITSHSPYFIRAIECLSDKYDMMDHLNVYLVAQGTDGEQQIDNMMESEYGMTELYDKLSAPLDSLQDEIDQKYS